MGAIGVMQSASGTISTPACVAARQPQATARSAGAGPSLAAPLDPRATRRTLLERVAGGDEAGWEEFYCRYAGLIDWYCRERAIPPLTSPHDRQLVVQAVMVFFHTHGPRYDDRRGVSFRSYLIGVTRKKIHEVRRELHRPCESVPADNDVAPACDGIADEADPASAYDGREQHDRLLKLLERLRHDPAVRPEHFRVLGLLLDGVPADEIHRQTGLGLNNLYVIKHRLIRRLRELDRQEAAS